MEEVLEFLKAAGMYFLATEEGDQPRVRAFATNVIYEGKLYIQTGKVKPVSKQMAANPKIELCAFKDGRWLRLAAEAVNDDSVEAKQYVLDLYPELKNRYAADDGNTQVLYLKNATATFDSFEGEHKVIQF